MGRTKRHRNKRIPKSERHNWSDIIALQKSMRVKCSNLQLSYFENSGRGIKCNKKINEGDILMSLPFDDLITRTSPSDIFSVLDVEDCTTQFVLSILLVYEDHLYYKSKYFNYINTLPLYYTNLFFCSQKEIDTMPSFMRHTLLKETLLLKDCNEKLPEMIQNKKCPHCGAALEDVFLYENFIWAWFTVNTRSVYFEDEPNKASQALAPYLDMFNHSEDVDTKMIIDRENQQYKLQTLTPFEKYDQVFIKYASHSNLKLLIEYGFILPENPNDYVEFGFLEIVEEVMKYDKTYAGLTNWKYLVISENNLSYKLRRYKHEFSWNFYSLLYILVTKDDSLLKFRTKIYSGQFSPEEKEAIRVIGERLLVRKYEALKERVKEMEEIEDCTESFKIAKVLARMYVKLLE